MEFLIIGTATGYEVRLDGQAGGEFSSEAELREYLRGMGISDRKISVALKAVNAGSGSNREFRLYARPPRGGR
jgi:hypothetical protein